MLIDTVGQGNHGSSKSNYSAKTVVFTSYKHASGDKNWYPSIFFYNLDSKEMAWQIHGAEIFVSIETKPAVEASLSIERDPANIVVTILTNEMWSKSTEEEFLQNPSEFSRHKDHHNYMIKLGFGDPSDRA